MGACLGSLVTLEVKPVSRDLKMELVTACRIPSAPRLFIQCWASQVPLFQGTNSCWQPWRVFLPRQVLECAQVPSQQPALPSGRVCHQVTCKLPLTAFFTNHLVFLW